MTKHNDTHDGKSSQTRTGLAQQVIYQITIKGHLDDQWTDWFLGLSVTLEENGYTLLTGPVVYLAALF